jgi:LPXTG-motif cell wall-anchored protein
METQNISAQLFNKQLPLAQEATFTGCKRDLNTNYLTTCVDYIDSDKNIEDAFQKQLDLSDYYKSVQVFDKMKEIFNTNEGIFDTSKETVNTTNTTFSKPVYNEPPILPVGPRDSIFKSLTKESFGTVSKESFGENKENNTNWFMIIGIILFVLLVAVLVYSMNKKNRN